MKMFALIQFLTLQTAALRLLSSQITHKFLDSDCGYCTSIDGNAFKDYGSCAYIFNNTNLNLICDVIAFAEFEFVEPIYNGSHFVANIKNSDFSFDFHEKTMNQWILDEAYFEMTLHQPIDDKCTNLNAGSLYLQPSAGEPNSVTLPDLRTFTFEQCDTLLSEYPSCKPRFIEYGSWARLYTSRGYTPKRPNTPFPSFVMAVTNCTSDIIKHVYKFKLSFMTYFSTSDDS